MSRTGEPSSSKGGVVAPAGYGKFVKGSKTTTVPTKTGEPVRRGTQVRVASVPFPVRPSHIPPFRPVVVFEW